MFGLFSWISQEAVSFALVVVKSGTVSAFFNIGLVIAFLVDTLYFKRTTFATDYLGALLIIVSTTIQGVISNKDYAESVKASQHSENVLERIEDFSSFQNVFSNDNS